MQVTVNALTLNDFLGKAVRIFDELTAPKMFRDEPTYTREQAIKHASTEAFGPSEATASWLLGLFWRERPLLTRPGTLDPTAQPERASLYSTMLDVASRALEGKLRAYLEDRECRLHPSAAVERAAANIRARYGTCKNFGRRNPDRLLVELGRAARPENHNVYVTIASVGLVCSDEIMVGRFTSVRPGLEPYVAALVVKENHPQGGAK